MNPDIPITAELRHEALMAALDAFEARLRERGVWLDAIGWPEHLHIAIEELAAEVAPDPELN
jgi:hypothetical protein